MQSQIKRLLILCFIVLSSVCIFPTPKYSELGEYIELVNQGTCAAFHLIIEENEGLSVMPADQNNPYEKKHGEYYLDKVIERIQKISKCRLGESETNMHPIHLIHNKSLGKEAYIINSSKERVSIHFSTYSGYVYGLESFSQMIKDGNKIQTGYIEDEPIVSYRGIMIDSVRHFIGIEFIKRLISSMALSKLNILHWHLADDEAFVLDLIVHPELSEASRYSESESYSIAQIEEVINFAKVNGISIVPEFDTPGHVRSWGLSKKWQDKNITILCNGGEHYNHQFDLSKSEVYDLVREVLQEGDHIFKDSPFIHLGGDEVSSKCWDLRPSIQTFMKQKHLQNYGELQMYWRNHLKQSFPKNRKLIYWLNTASNLTTSSDETVQYWGYQRYTASETGRSSSKLILSPLDYVYLNLGTTSIWMNSTNGDFKSWRQIYTGFTLTPPDVSFKKILGAEAVLWNEVQNEDTLENEIWMRAAAFAAKIWRNEVGPLSTLVKDLVHLQKQLIVMGVKPSPITNEFCEIYPEKCFSTTKQEEFFSEQSSNELLID